MIPDDTPLFDPCLLAELDWSQNAASFYPAISPVNPGEGLVLRPLCTSDLNRDPRSDLQVESHSPARHHSTASFCGFFKVLGQLTDVGDVTTEQFIRKFEHMKRSGDYFAVVVEDLNLGQIVATATLIVEHKFIHGCAKRGRIEEVVVSDECRGKQLGKLLLSVLTLLSKALGCYKVTLECKPKNVAFYQKFGYVASDETYMQRRFAD